MVIWLCNSISSKIKSENPRNFWFTNEFDTQTISFSIVYLPVYYLILTMSVLQMLTFVFLLIRKNILLHLNEKWWNISDQENGDGV